MLFVQIVSLISRATLQYFDFIKRFSFKEELYLFHLVSNSCMISSKYKNKISYSPVFNIALPIASFIN